MNVMTHADQGRRPTGEPLLWSIKTVVQKTGLSRASIYRYVSRNLFPPPRRIGPNRVAWVAAEVMGWIEQCPCRNS